MSEATLQVKPIDESGLKPTLILSQIRIHQAFREPKQCILMVLNAIVYIQCLKYPFDQLSTLWFNRPLTLFGYFSLSSYFQSVDILVSSVIGLLVYLVCSLTVYEKTRQNIAVLTIAKAIQLVFGTVLYSWIVGDLCKFIGNPSIQIWKVLIAVLSLLLFNSGLLWQIFLRFDFMKSLHSGLVKKSNWGGVSILIYILANEIGSQIDESSKTGTIVIMNIGIILHCLIFFIKKEHEEYKPMKIQLIFITLNVVAIVMVDIMVLVSISLNIVLWILVSSLLAATIYHVQLFNLQFELENVNKWNTSQIMISYSAKLRQIHRNLDDYYYHTMLLGYIEVHQQKCDNEACPLRRPGEQKILKKIKLQDLLKKIYNDGLKMSPIDPQLQLQYAIFLKQINCYEKSLKMLLQIKINELAFDKYYKFTRLKNQIHKQICTNSEKEFLDLLSEIKVKDLQIQIMKKFEQAALVNLQFWSVLNEDHPDFRKLNDVGKSRVMVTHQVHSLYEQISKLAHSQRITSIYIHYLTDIENDERLFEQVYHSLKKYKQLQDRVIIEDWNNSHEPIMIVSVQEDRYGHIIDLNTTCATILGYQKYDILNRQVYNIFPSGLNKQIKRFLGNNTSSLELTAAYQVISQGKQNVFYIGYSNGYCLKIDRKIHHYNSIETGVSLIINLKYNFTINSCFIVFDNEDGNKILAVSSTCIQLLGISNKIIDGDKKLTDIFLVDCSFFTDEKKIVTLQDTFMVDALANYCEEDEIEETLKGMNESFQVYRESFPQFFVIHFTMHKIRPGGIEKTRKQDMKMRTQGHDEKMFSFQVHDPFDNFSYLGGRSIEERVDNNLAYDRRFTTEDHNGFSNNKNLAQGISTLRLHENYIKVIQDAESEGEEDMTASVSNLNNQIVGSDGVAYTITKKDLERVFANRESYWQFLQKNEKKNYIRLILFIVLLLTIGSYLGYSFKFRNDFNEIQQNYQNIKNENLMLGQVTYSSFVMYLMENRFVNGRSDLDQILISSLQEMIEELQHLVSVYTKLYDIEVIVSQEGDSSIFQSNQFILSMINYINKINSQLIEANYDFDQSIQIDQQAIFFIFSNSDHKIRNQMNDQIDRLKEDSFSVINSHQMANILLLCGGIVLQIIVGLLISCLIKKVDQQKVEILSIFLDTTEKDIQMFSDKTQNFLITLHVEESAEAQGNLEQQNQAKKYQGSSAMFTKKKRFKSAQYPKTTYASIVIFFIAFVGFYIHNFTYNYEKLIFLQKSVQYIDYSSQFQDVFSKDQSSIQKIFYDSRFGEVNRTKIQQIASIQNVNLLSYERDFFKWHYQTFGNIPEFHEVFSKVFMYDICNGQIKIKHACESPLMSSNGTLMVITDITIMNQLLSSNGYIPTEYYNSFEIIKHSHEHLLEEIQVNTRKIFMQISNYLTTLIVCWSLLAILIIILYNCYIRMVILRELKTTKDMLKVLPVSFAKDSRRTHQYIGMIIHQNQI